MNDTTYELPFSADVNSSTVLKQCAEQWVEDYVNQTIKSGMVQWRILSVREDENKISIWLSSIALFFALLAAGFTFLEPLRWKLIG